MLDAIHRALNQLSQEEFDKIFPNNYQSLGLGFDSYSKSI
jgi:hypothetical protein